MGNSWIFVGVVAFVIVAGWLVKKAVAKFKENPPSWWKK